MKALFCSDLHLIGEKPIARLDTNWLEIQRKMLLEIVALANFHNVDLYMVGDVFDTVRVSQEVLNMTVETLKQCVNKVWVLIGNHCAPGHDPMAAMRVGSIGILCKVFNDAESSPYCVANHFGRDHNPNGTLSETKVRLTHQLVFPDQASKPPTDKGKTADELLAEFPDSQWIIAGDGHDAFHRIAPDGRHVVNLGCTIRHKASEIDYTPSVWLIDTDAEVVDRIPLDDDRALVTREHLVEKAEKDSRIAAFLEVVKGSEAVKLDFMANLKGKLAQLSGAELAALTAIVEKVQEESK